MPATLSRPRPRCHRLHLAQRNLLLHCRWNFHRQGWGQGRRGQNAIAIGPCQLPLIPTPTCAALLRDTRPRPRPRPRLHTRRRKTLRSCGGGATTTSCCGKGGRGRSRSGGPEVRDGPVELRALPSRPHITRSRQLLASRPRLLEPCSHAPISLPLSPPLASPPLSPSAPQLHPTDTPGRA